MKKLSQLFALLLVIAVILGLAACGRQDNGPSPATTSPDTTAPSTSEEPSEPSEDEEFVNTIPISDEKVTISAWRAWSSTFYSDPNEIFANQEIEKLTNVHVDFTCAPTQGSQEAFNLMVISDDFTDIIYGYWASSEPYYAGGIDKAIADGVYVDITDFLKYATNFKARLEQYSDARRQATTDSGALFFPAIQSGNQPAWYGTMVRTDWLEDAGLSEPTTIDDWYNMLTTFKNNGRPNAMFLSNAGYDLLGFGVVGAFNSPPTFYNKDGVVHFGGIEDGYKEYLTTMAKWYAEDLIDRDFVSRTSRNDQGTLFSQDKVGAADGAVYSSAINYPFLHGGDGVKWEAVPLPVMNKGDIGHFRRVNEIVGTGGAFPTMAAVKNGNIETVIRYIDFSYSEEGSAILNYGVEGLTWEWGSDGLPHFTDFYLNNDEYQLTDMRDLYTDSQARGGYYMWVRENDSYPQEVLDGQSKWMESSSGDWVMPPVTLTSEEAEEYARLYNDIETFINEFTLSVITGNTSISEWDNYVGTIKGLNIDRCIELYQQALDRYNAR